MKYLQKLKASAKQVPVPVWIAGLIIPGGMVAISLYTLWKASRKDKPKRTFREFIDSMIKEAKEEENDRS